MRWWRSKRSESPLARPEAIRARYQSFRDLLALNNESLELMAGLQEDLQYVTPRRDVLETRVEAILDKTLGTVASLEKLSGLGQPQLRTAVETSRAEVQRYLAECQEATMPRMAASLTEIGVEAGWEAGDKAAPLGEIKKLGLPVPNGYVLTTEAYRQFCGTPLWSAIRDALRQVDLNDAEALRSVSNRLTSMVLALPVPRTVEVAITERARTLDGGQAPLAVRSSAVGEGGARTYAGQFLSLINVPAERAVDAYKRVIAARFSERALFYRLSAGLLEVETPMAVLFLPVIRARAAGIMYTRDPNDAKSRVLWITATRGLGLDIASGRMPADLFVISRKRRHELIESNVVEKREEIVLQPGGGLGRKPLGPEQGREPAISEQDARTLAEWGLRIEDHFKTPQDIEWAQDEHGGLWIVQARPLALGGPEGGRTRMSSREQPVLSGGRTIYPGQVSGPVWIASDSRSLTKAPNQSVVFIRRASPEIVQMLPRIGGLVAEGGNVAGHAAALLREFKVPSVFGMPGGADAVQSGEMVSLDSVQARLYRGEFFPRRKPQASILERYRAKSTDPISRRLLALTLLDPAASNFRPSGCKSAHDVLRYCHEKAIEAMFAVSDLALAEDMHPSKQLITDLPVNLHVLDLGGGLATADATAGEVKPGEIVCRPFQALWRGISHPDVSWKRNMPASLSDLASVMAASFTPQSGAMRALGDRSYLLVSDEYMNLNSRLAYHFSLVDACLSDIPGENYISFRFEGGGSTAYRRSLRACFIEACLAQFGFQVDRRSDLVNAWFKKAPAAETEQKLDVLGRLMACSSQLDMYMTSQEVMRWYVQQFLQGNYSFQANDVELTGRSSS